MFSSIFSTSAPVDPTATNFHAVSSRYPPNELYGELTPKDTEWLATSSGFITETQIFYTVTEDGTSVMCQVIHSSVGLWYPTVQFTFKLHNPNAPQKTIWKSINVTNFVTPPPGLDRRSSKSDEFSISYQPASGSSPDTYEVRANLGTDVQIFLTMTRDPSASGFKVGSGPEGGFSYFGVNKEEGKRDGYVIHRFWPLYHATGSVVVNGQAKIIEKGNGMMVHAIQGMRPNLVAARWNFAHFQGEDGVTSAIQMEFTTTDSYGPKGAGSGGFKVNVGSLVVDAKLVCVTAETTAGGKKSSSDTVVSKAEHLRLTLDPDTGYDQPGAIAYEWKGPAVGTPSESYEAQLTVDLLEGTQPKGLIEKVDVLAEIPYVLKMAVNYVAGTKPYIYQWFNPAEISIKRTGSADDKEITVKGTLYNEATFIS